MAAVVSSVFLLTPAAFAGGNLAKQLFELVKWLYEKFHEELTSDVDQSTDD